MISIYVDDQRLLDHPSATKLFGRLERLNEFWGGKKLAEINGETCREYARQVGSEGGARRDLEDLRAAVNHQAKEGYHRGIVRVVLPPKGKARDRWLTRDEVARLLRVCWRAREYQTIHRGPNKGTQIETDRRPLRHLARFILMALYTGTRSNAVTTASIKRGEGRSFVDLDNRIFYRLAEGRRENEEATAPRANPASSTGSSTSPARQARRSRFWRGVEWRTNQVVGQDGVQQRRHASRSRRSRNTSYFTAYSRDVVDAGRRR